MIVDDEDDITFMFQIALEENNFIVDTFNDPVLALSEYKPGYYDLIILDILLPNVDGYALAKKIRQEDKHTKICFITASEKYHKQYRDMDLYDENEQYQIIQKPIEIEDLVIKINQFIDDSSYKYHLKQ